MRIPWHSGCIIVPWHSSCIIVLNIVILCYHGTVEGVIIPPRWANLTVNPCAGESWQLIHWPHNNQCYKIFSQGPCSETQELYFNEETGKAVCKCSRGTLWHPDSERCHDKYSRGPCGHRQYLAPKETEEEKLEGFSKQNGVCRSYDDCSPGHIFWPPAKKCFQHLSRGPCLHGHLLFADPDTGLSECGCDPNLMSTNYWIHGDSCHELFTRGPCVQGHIFLYNHTTTTTECVCGPNLLTNYHESTGKCYELEKTGPCRQGQIFTYDSVTNRAACTCIPEYAEWGPTGNCYRTFTRGPCLSGEFLRPERKNKGIGVCDKNLCKQGELYDSTTEGCYPVGRRGPCSRGKLWVFERANSIRGMCYCDSHLIGYWAPHEQCYELGERGPCPKRRVLSYDKQSGNLTCRCDYRMGYVPWVNGRCIKAGVRRENLVSISNPLSTPERGNSIQAERIHRGLTLPLSNAESSLSTALQEETPSMVHNVQTEILNDIMHTIQNASFSKANHTDLPEEIPQRTTNKNVKKLHKSEPDQTETFLENLPKTNSSMNEILIHRVTMSRSITRDLHVNLHHEKEIDSEGTISETPEEGDPLRDRPVGLKRRRFTARNNGGEFPKTRSSLITRGMGESHLRREGRAQNRGEHPNTRIFAQS